MTSSYLARCQNLRSLHILVDEDLFEPLERHAKLPWEEPFTNDELSRMLSQRDILAVRKLENIPGLDHINFDVTGSHFLNSSAKCEVFNENLGRLLAIARQIELTSSEGPKIVERVRAKHASSARLTSGAFVLRFFCFTQVLLILCLAPSLGWAYAYAIVAAIACVLA
jgi:hypothetical protein